MKTNPLVYAANVLPDAVRMVFECDGAMADAAPVLPPRVSPLILNRIFQLYAFQECNRHNPLLAPKLCKSTQIVDICFTSFKNHVAICHEDSVIRSAEAGESAVARRGARGSRSAHRPLEVISEVANSQLKRWEASGQ